MKKAIPHIFTLGNLLCGVLSIRAIFNDAPMAAVLFVFVAAVLDFFDGLLARALGVSGELGKQLDSLADNVTFGVVPALMFLSINGFLQQWPTDVLGWLLFATSLLVAAMATLRLAKFNIDSRQTSGFIGMPTPGNTLLVTALYYIYFLVPDAFLQPVLQHRTALLLATTLVAIWQVLPIPLMALKFKTWQIATNSWRYIFLAMSAALFAIFFISAIPIIILLYFLLSIAQNTSNKKA